ncbi:3-hydroxyacyl-[acyl-carrier-protein] dehydratase [Nymphaea thermarum]|nr:3-hydroxyacyl-[acyl-carrier-protein] dehydratase [Nymphaea thermarum]
MASKSFVSPSLAPPPSFSARRTCSSLSTCLLPSCGRNFSPLSLSNRVPYSWESSKRRNGLITLCSGTEGSGEVEEVPIEKQFPAFPTVLDINQIRDILPHRFPFLLVDRVIEYNPGVSAVAIKNVTINDNFFPGHFPERPIMPGVLMIEALAQVGGIVMLQPEVGGSRENFFFAGIDKVRFRKPVIAGDTLVMRMNLVKLQKRFGIAKMEGKAYVGGEVVCEGEFLMATGSG